MTCSFSLPLVVCPAETAENIGYSCNLLREEMTEVFVISGHSVDEVHQELRLLSKTLFSYRSRGLHLFDPSSLTEPL